MKDGFRRFEIEPLESTLDFMGPAQSSETVKMLEGTVRLSLSRPTKIRSMAVKFKGFGRVSIKGKYNNNVGIFTPMLPKLKCHIAGKTLLPAGDHVIPWDIEIPNIYPPSLLIKRATIFYRVEVVVSFALSKSITAEHPITLRRHLLPCMELAPLVETKFYEHTVPAKFHYEIEAPQIICLDQLLLPFAVKYLCIANQKAVQNIRTQLTQIELYRIQSVSKTDANLTLAPMDVYNLEKKVLECKQRRDYAKFIKRTIPALIHSVDQTRSSAWKQPIVLRHKLHQFLQPTFDSPLVSIHHQLEITFQFDHRFEDIKAKIPIIIASIPATSNHPPGNSTFWSSVTASDSKYPFETVTRFESMSVVPEENDRSVPRASEDSNSHRGISSLVIDPAISALPLPPAQLPVSNRRNTGNGTATRTTAKSLATRKSSEGLDDNHYQPSFYPASSNDLLDRKKSVKRHNSEYDLNAFTNSSLLVPEERPRTTTPMQRRQRDMTGGNNTRRRRPLPPIDVELANGIKPKSLPKIVDPLTEKSTSSSEVLPEADRSILQSQSNHNITQDVSNEDNCDTSDENEFDFQSVYSDLSLPTPEAPSLSSSATEASIGSHHTLLTRPPSPEYQPAPGLPSNTALRSHEEQSTALVEESFAYATITSPAVATVASSVLLSPCTSTVSTTTSSTTRRRIALSSVSSIMNGGDALSFRSFGGPFTQQQQNRISDGSGNIPMVPSTSSTTNSKDNNYNSKNSYTSSLRESTVLEPNAQQGSTNLPETADSNNSNNSNNSIDPKQHYLHAKLPPIPTTTTCGEPYQATSPIPAVSVPGAVIPRVKKNNQQDAPLTPSVLNETKRMTRLYVDDSDDETLDPLPPIPEKQAWKRTSLGSPTTALNNNNDGPSVVSPSTPTKNSTVHKWATSILNNAAVAPQLPRLSFGLALGDSLGLDQFKRK
ncbi:hypothetical protein BCR42DRAFT_393455 [Absidia repens]|uniref:Arrestin C-terminal-like domain-containing protein n=1 Tax=Absidia repens TaxID=90262 RepID=A0A1X2IDR3_9FUNG|nr:hypothetical protein BCR42DRAFT_393455 [Absidia repens]